MSIKRKHDCIDITQLVSATRVLNHIRNDPIIDYLDTLDNNNFKVNNDLEIIKKDTLEDKSIKKRKTAFDYIVEEGYNFENKIVDKIKKYMIKNKLKNKIITIKKENDLIKQFEKTKEAIEKFKYEVILGGLLINKKNNTYGYPDIIVLGSWINKFFVSAPYEYIKNDIYYIIDIKSSTINLISEG